MRIKGVHLCLVRLRISIETYFYTRSWLMLSQPNWSLPGIMVDLVMKLLLEGLIGVLFLKDSCPLLAYLDLGCNIPMF